MSSVTSQIAQIGRRINYLRVSADCSGYTMAAGTDSNSWAAPSAAVNFATSTILQDMGEIAKYGGQVFRKVRAVTQTPIVAGGVATAYFIVMPGGEYPVQGVPAGSVLAVAQVARLG